VADVAEAIIGGRPTFQRPRKPPWRLRKPDLPVPNIDLWVRFWSEVLSPPPHFTDKTAWRRYCCGGGIIGHKFVGPASRPGSLVRPSARDTFSPIESFIQTISIQSHEGRLPIRLYSLRCILDFRVRSRRYQFSFFDRYLVVILHIFDRDTRYPGVCKNLYLRE